MFPDGVTVNLLLFLAAQVAVRLVEHRRRHHRARLADMIDLRRFAQVEIGVPVDEEAVAADGLLSHKREKESHHGGGAG